MHTRQENDVPHSARKPVKLPAGGDALRNDSSSDDVRSSLFGSHDRVEAGTQGSKYERAIESLKIRLVTLEQERSSVQSQLLLSRGSEDECHSVINHRRSASEESSAPGYGIAKYLQSNAASTQTVPSLDRVESYDSDMTPPGSSTSEPDSRSVRSDHNSRYDLEKDEAQRRLIAELTEAVRRLELENAKLKAKLKEEFVPLDFQFMEKMKNNRLVPYKSSGLLDGDENSIWVKKFSDRHKKTYWKNKVMI